MAGLQLFFAALEAVKPGGLPDAVAGEGTIKTTLSILFGIAGALALVMMTVSGLRYILSAGDAQKVSKAKNGIVYALVGLIVCITAEAIVAFVTRRV